MEVICVCVVFFSADWLLSGLIWIRIAESGEQEVQLNRLSKYTAFLFQQRIYLSFTLLMWHSKQAWLHLRSRNLFHQIKGK